MLAGFVVWFWGVVHLHFNNIDVCVEEPVETILNARLFGAV